MRNYFGTDGIRGPANRYPMTVETSLRLGQAVATMFSREGHRARILVGKDTRLSGYMFESALVAGITSVGADVTLLGPLPTPGIAFLTTSMRADAGIVISASHNTYEDNGFKVFGRDGFKLPDSLEEELEALMDQDRSQSLPTGELLGRAKRVEDAVGRYITHLKRILRPDFDLDGLKIVVDCANGAAYKAGPALLRELGAQVHEIGTAPNGLNINDQCGSLHPERAQAAISAHGAHLGICLDGDADRLVLIDEKGKVVDGDALLALIAISRNRAGKLPGNTFVGTVMNNIGLERALNDEGIRLQRADVGDRYVVEAMRQGNFHFGGEPSGHLVFLEHSTTGDGLAAAIEVLNILLETGRPLSELSAVFTPVPQILLNSAVGAKPPIESLPSVCAAIAAAESQLGDSGRVFVRYSGTEPLARVMVEGDDENLIRSLAHDIIEAFHFDIAPSEP